MEGEFTLRKADMRRVGEDAFGRIQMIGARVNKVPSEGRNPTPVTLMHVSMCGSDQEGEKIRAVAKAERNTWRDGYMVREASERASRTRRPYL